MSFVFDPVDSCKKLIDELNNNKELRIIIKLHSKFNLSNQNNFLVDVIDGRSEESFTLETFANLVLNYRLENKELIIARVVTVLPDDPLKMFFSYYQAHHINKLLFQIEPTEPVYLHRIPAKNPLNNMRIASDVHYYRIPLKMVDLAIQKFFDSKTENDEIFNDFKKIHLKSLSDSEEHCLSRSNLSLNSLLDASKTLIVFDGVFFATENDYGTKKSVKEFFKINAFYPEDAKLFEYDRMRNHSRLTTQSAAARSLGLINFKSVEGNSQYYSRENYNLRTFLYLLIFLIFVSLTMAAIIHPLFALLALLISVVTIFVGQKFGNLR